MQVDLINSIGQVADLGVEGIILWGDNYSQNNKTSCQTTKMYVDKMLGPYVTAVKKFVQRCSDSLCSSRGRCYTTDLSRLLDTSEHQVAVHTYHRWRNDLANLLTDWRDSEELLDAVGNALTGSYERTHSYQDIVPSIYKCRCLEGYSGPSCDKTI